MRTRLFALGLAGALAAAPLIADGAISFYGTTENKPTFNRPSGLASLSDFATNVRYDVVGFYPNVNSTCSIYSIQEGGTFDGYIALYQSSFNPASPLTNLIAVDDDFSSGDGGLGIGTSAIEQVALSFVSNWYVVVTGFANDDQGSYHVNISCDVADRVLPASGSQAVYDGRIHALQQGRFQIWATWRDFALNTGFGTFVPMGSADSGVMWFFAPNNWEVLIKVIDACSFNNRFWVFYAATTNVEFIINVLDTETDTLKQYPNALGVSAPAITDTNAFATCP